MASSFLIPTVTPDDLLRFHSSHFGKAFTGSSLVTGSDHDQQVDRSLKDDEDDLGYYSDGCPWTLTDEQIKIFRHSEIQRLLLKQRRDAEMAMESSTSQEVEEDTRVQALSMDNPKSNEEDGKSLLSNIPKSNKEQFVASTKKARDFTRQKHEEEYNWRVSTRRRVRELDDITKQDNVVLEY